MRNWRYVLLILPLLALTAGCAGTPAQPDTGAALDQTAAGVHAAANQPDTGTESILSPC